MSKDSNNIESVITAPEICCLIKNAELVLLFFNLTKAAFKQNKNVVFDMTKTTFLDESFVALLMSHIKDKSVTNGLASRIELPKETECAKKLSRLGVFKKTANSKAELLLDDNQNHTKVTSLIVANDVARQIVDASSQAIYGRSRKIKPLYAVLIELMANTNNHAGKASGETLQWWLHCFFNEEEKKIKFIFLDLGTGILESIPVKRYQKSKPFSSKINDPLHMLSSEYKIEHYNRYREMLIIFEALVAGKIKSSTGISARGKGIPLVCSLAMSDHFERFILISNDAYIDINGNKIYPMDQKLNGTLFYFELKESQINE